MCGRWYLPTFLRDGLLTLIYKASLMVLIRFWSSSHYAEVIYANLMTSGVIYGGWGPFCIFFITVHPVTFISVDDPTLFQHGILVFGGHQEVFDGNTSLEMDLYPIFASCSLYVLIYSLIVWYHYVWSLTTLLIV